MFKYRLKSYVILEQDRSRPEYLKFPCSAEVNIKADYLSSNIQIFKAFLMKLELCMIIKVFLELSYSERQCSQTSNSDHLQLATTSS